MTELQMTINNLGAVILSAGLVLEKLEKAQKDLDKPKVPVFPISFTAVRDESIRACFVIGLENPATWDELPSGYKGRAAFDEGDIRQIIRGLQTLLGESDG